MSAEMSSGKSMRSPLRVEIVDDIATLEGLRKEWNDLLERSPGVTGFNAPGAVLPWFRSVMSHSKIYVVAIWRQDELVALAPFSVIRLGPFQLYCSAGTNFGFHGGPLLGAEPEPVATVLSEHIGRIVRRGTAAVHLRRVPTTNHLLAALDARDDNTCITVNPDEKNGVIRFDLMDDPEEYFKRIGRKHQVPRRSRRLAERFATVGPLTEDPEPHSALAALRDMLMRLDGEEPRIFRDAHLNSLAHDMVDELAADGHSRISTITGDGRRLVVIWDLHVGKRVFGYAFAYEPEFRQLSLGNLGNYLSLRQLHESGIVEVDLDGLTGFAYKQNWINDVRDYRTIAVTAPGRLGVGANHLRQVTVRLHRRLNRARQRGPAVI